jgi:DNA primase
MAGKIPQSFIDDILERSDIVELIDSRVKLKKTGRNYQALCPFHDEKTPSFSVNPDKQYYYCFGCGAGGNAISFLMDYERSDFPETIEKLAQHLGLQVPREDNPVLEAQQKAKKSIYDLLEQASNFYQQQLRQHSNKASPINYLKGRGLTGDICKQFGIGYAPPGWDNLLKQLGQSEENKQLLAEGGMLIEKDNGQGFYDRFRERLMFPIRDNRGRTIAFGGRVLNDDKPKYLNSPETPVFHKQTELYGLFEARKANRHLERLLMVEGYMDVVALAQFGINWAVATLGTSAGTAHMEKVFRHCNEVIFCFDGDEAGRKAADRALEAVIPLMQDGRQAKFLLLPEGEDPDSLVRSVGTEQFLWQIDRAPSLSQYLFERESQGLDLSRADDKALLVSRLSPRIAAIPQGPFKILLEKQLSEQSGLSTDDIHALSAEHEAQSSASASSNNTNHNNFSENTANEHSAFADKLLPKQRQKLDAQQRQVKRTPAKAASAMLLFKPQIIGEQSIKLELDEAAIEQDSDLQLLQKLLSTIEAEPELHTNSIIGKFLAEKENGITQLLALEHQIEDLDKHSQEFFEAIKQINAKAQKLKRSGTIAEIDSSTTLDQLSDEQKAKYLAIFNKEKPSA